MTRKLLAVFTSITAALLVVSVAWAAGDAGRQDDDTDARVAGGAEATAAVSAEASSSSTGVSTPGDSSSTSVTTAGSSSTSTTANGSSTSSTIQTEVVTASGGTFQVPDVGSVTLEIRAGLLVLTDFSAPGWDVRIKDVRPDRVRLEFRKGEAKAEFEAELEAGRLEIEIKSS